MPDSISTLATAMLHNPVRVDISPETRTADRIEQYVAFVQKQDKRQLLIDIIEGQMVACGIVFTRTRHGANRLAKQLSKVGIPADSIHGDKSQTARTRALDAFKNGDVFILVATDIASHTQLVDPSTCFLTAAEPAAFARGILDALGDEARARQRAAAAAELYERRSSRRAYVDKMRDDGQPLPAWAGGGEEEPQEMQ